MTGKRSIYPEKNLGVPNRSLGGIRQRKPPRGLQGGQVRNACGDELQNVGRDCGQRRVCNSGLTRRERDPSQGDWGDMGGVTATTRIKGCQSNSGHQKKKDSAWGVRKWLRS